MTDYQPSFAYHFIADEQGSLVEFTLVLHLFFLLIMTIIESGIILSIKMGLEIGVEDGARNGLLGKPLSTVTASMQAATLGIMTSSNITTSVQSYATCAQISGSNPATVGTPSAGTSGLGSSGNFVLYTASYTYQPITPVVAGIFGSNFVIRATSMSKNN